MGQLHFQVRRLAIALFVGLWSALALAQTGPNSGGSSSPSGTAGGDLSGTYPNPSVAKVNGQTVTLGGALTTSGAFATTITSTATTNSTLPAGTHTLAGLDVAQTWTGIQQFNSGQHVLAGSMSGLLTINCAAVCGTNTLTLPAGTTDFSATGGASQVVKQTSAGGALTVATVNFTDLAGSNTVAQIGGSAASHAVPVDVAGTSTYKVVPDCQDSAGNHLNYTQSTDVFACGTSAGLSVTFQQFVTSANGTYTPNANLLYAVVECVGQGGGGGGAAASATGDSSGGGGGAGSYSRVRLTAAQIGVSKAITNTAAANGGTSGNNAGTGGNDTSLGTLCVGKGGSGGGGAAANSAGTAGAGGVAGTGDITLVGNSGHRGFSAAITTASGPSGAGGVGPWGGGAPGVDATAGVVAGIAGTACGSGGSGGQSEGSASATTGGAGGNGCVFVTEFNSK